MAGAQQQKGANSILEGLSGVMSQLASLSVLPDAAPHVSFVNSLMAEIQKFDQTSISGPNVAHDIRWLRAGQEFDL